MYNNIANPFVIGRYVSKEYFCDRENDTEFLRKQIVNGRNVALISPRRIGKSGLIQHFFNQPDIQEAYHVFYVDIYATTSLGEFVYTLGKEIYEQLKPQSTVWKEKFFQTIASLRIGAKLDRTHATVLHACIQIEQRMSIEKDFSREVQAITASLTQ